MQCPVSTVQSSAACLPSASRGEANHCAHDGVAKPLFDFSDIERRLSPRRTLGVGIPAQPPEAQRVHPGAAAAGGGALAALHAKASNSSLPAVYQKYSQPKFNEVAKLVVGPITL